MAVVFEIALLTSWKRHEPFVGAIEESDRVAWVILGSLGALVLVFVLWMVTILNYGEGELREKPVFAALQQLSMDESTNRQVGPINHRMPDGHAYLGVPGVGETIDDKGSWTGSNRMWIVLNDHSPSLKIRQMNRFNTYDLRCDYIATIRKNVIDVDGYVLRYLQTICHRP